MAGKSSTYVVQSVEKLVVFENHSPQTDKATKGVLVSLEMMSDIEGIYELSTSCTHYHFLINNDTSYERPCHVAQTDCQDCVFKLTKKFAHHWNTFVHLHVTCTSNC